MQHATLLERRGRHTHVSGRHRQLQSCLCVRDDAQNVMLTVALEARAHAAPPLPPQANTDISCNSPAPRRRQRGVGGVSRSPSP